MVWLLGFASVAFLGCSLQSLSGIISEQPPANGGGLAYLMVAIPRCGMNDLTRSNSLTRVHNGRISHQCATLLEEQVNPTHRLSSASEAKERNLCYQNIT